MCAHYIFIKSRNPVRDFRFTTTRFILKSEMVLSSFTLSLAAILFRSLMLCVTQQDPLTHWLTLSVSLIANVCSIRRSIIMSIGFPTEVLSTFLSRLSCIKCLVHGGINLSGSEDGGLRLETVMLIF